MSKTTVNWLVVLCSLAVLVSGCSKQSPEDAFWSTIQDQRALQPTMNQLGREKALYLGHQICADIAQRGSSAVALDAHIGLTQAGLPVNEATMFLGTVVNELCPQK